MMEILWAFVKIIWGLILLWLGLYFLIALVQLGMPTAQRKKKKENDQNRRYKDERISSIH